MGEPRFSIVTPTRSRSPFLPHLFRCIAAQETADWEWLILDDSEERFEGFDGLGDPRVVYIHEDRQRSVGEKRNLLVERARGEFIAHMDDDDYYAPRYLASLGALLSDNGGDFAKLTAFFIYHLRARCWGYWDLTVTSGRHYLWDSRAGPEILLEDSADAASAAKRFGYGFSFVYRKSVWEAAPFADVTFGEDAPFARAAAERFRYLETQDRVGLAAKTQHGANTSKAFPQHLVPADLPQRLMPGAEPHLRALAAYEA